MLVLTSPLAHVPDEIFVEGFRMEPLAPIISRIVTAFIHDPATFKRKQKKEKAKIT